VAVAAFVAPVIAGLIPRRLVPPVVLEVLAGLAKVLRDAGEVNSDFGQFLVMSGSVGEFGSLLLLTILFSAQPEPTLVQILYVAALGVAAMAGAVAIRRFWPSPWMRRVLLGSDDSTSQLRVRGGFVILLVFTALAHQFGVDALLCAFVAGIVLSVADRDDRPNLRRFQGKLHAVGYGFLVPVFFIGTGLMLDLRSLLASPSSLALLPVLVVAILVVRAAPALIFRGRAGTSPAVAAVLLQATTLTFPVVVAQVGRGLHLLTQSSAAALIGAALASVLLFPALAPALRPWSRPPAAVPAPGRGVTG
jgi:Kef-type K+ transport system membrane component KefB